MKKGFTLVELIGVIVLLGAVLLIVIPIVTNEIRKARENAYNDQIRNIEESAMNWLRDNDFRVPYMGPDINAFVITLAQLQQTGFAARDIRNPITRNLFPNDMLIEIRNDDGIVSAFVTKTISEGIECREPNAECTTDDTNIDFDEPFIQMRGNHVIYLEVGESFNDPGVLSESNVSTTGTVDITRLGILQIKYTAIQGTREVIHIRNVVVRDTTPPVINFSPPGVRTIHINDIAGFDLLTGVDVTDNVDSRDRITLTYEGRLVEHVSRQSIKYTATDSSGNTATRYRTFNVTE